MIKLLLHESKRRVGSPGVFITPGTYFINNILSLILNFKECLVGQVKTPFRLVVAPSNFFRTSASIEITR